MRAKLQLQKRIKGSQLKKKGRLGLLYALAALQLTSLYAKMKRMKRAFETRHIQ